MKIQLNKIYKLRENVLGIESDNTVKIVFVDGCLKFDFNIKSKQVYNPYIKDNDPLYEYDVVETFLSFDLNPTRYYEFELSPNGARFFGLIENTALNAPKATLIDPNFSYEVHLTKDGYIASINVELDKGVSLDKILLNCFSIDTDENGTQNLYALNPTFAPNFHLPKYFIQFDI